MYDCDQTKLSLSLITWTDTAEWNIHFNSNKFLHPVLMQEIYNSNRYERIIVNTVNLSFWIKGIYENQLHQYFVTLYIPALSVIALWASFIAVMMISPWDKRHNTQYFYYFFYFLFCRHQTQLEVKWDAKNPNLSHCMLYVTNFLPHCCM